MLCDYGCGQEARFQLKNSKWCCSKSQNSCPEVRRKHSRSIEGKPCSERAKQEVGKIWRGKKNLEHSKRMNGKNNPMYQKHHSIAAKQKIGEKNSGERSAAKRLEVRKKMSESGKGKHGGTHTKEHTEKLIISWKKNWNNKTLEEREKILAKIFKSCEMKPNKLEITLDNLIQFIKPNEFKYVGDGYCWIGGKNPDWININGKKRVIEFFGGYWHGEERRRKLYKDFMLNEEHEKERIEHYKKCGFDCLVIWEDQLKDIELLISKIKAL
jgi:hypothetical protein